MIEAVIFDWECLYKGKGGVFEDTRPSLIELQNAGIKMGLVSISNNKPMKELEVELSCLEDYFHTKIFSKDLRGLSQLQYYGYINLMGSKVDTTVLINRNPKLFNNGTEMGFQTFFLKRIGFPLDMPNGKNRHQTPVASSLNEILPYILKPGNF